MISKEDAGYFVAESCITVILNTASKRCVIVAHWYSVLNAFLKEYSFVSQSAKRPNRPSYRSTKLEELNGHRWHSVAVTVEYTVQRFHSSLCGKLNLIQKSSWFIIGPCERHRPLQGIVWVHCRNIAEWRCRFCVCQIRKTIPEAILVAPRCWLRKKLR